MSYGPDSETGGYILKTEDNIIEEVQDSANQIVDKYGNKFQENLRGDSIVGQFANILASSIAQAYQANQISYNIPNSNYATGQALEAIAKTFAGLTRKQATKSTVLVTITGTANATIGAGNVTISDVDDNNEWSNESSFTIGANGIVEGVNFLCTVAGDVTAGANTLTKLQQFPVPIESANNPTDAVAGTDQESDNSLRVRFQQSTEPISEGLTGGLVNNVLQIEGIKSASLNQNFGNDPEMSELPINSAALVVQYTDDVQDTDQLRKDIIAQIIVYDKMAQYNGNVTGFYVDYTGRKNYASYYLAIKVIIYVEVDIKIINSDLVPDNIQEVIADDIVEFANGGAGALGIPNDKVGGYAPGDDVIRTRLYTPINQSAGIEIVSLKIGTDANNLLEQDIEILFKEVATFVANDITVNVNANE